MSTVKCTKCQTEFTPSKNYAGTYYKCQNCRTNRSASLANANSSRLSTTVLEETNTNSQVGTKNVQSESKSTYDTRYREVFEKRKEYNRLKEQTKEYVWENAKKVEGKNPNKYREDRVGNIIYKSSYGKDTKMGWSIDHSKPLNMGGTNHKNNFQAMQMSQNKSKNDTYPYKYDNVKQLGVSKYDLIKTNVDKRSSLVKRGDLLFNYDGSIDSRSKAVRSGNVRLNADKTIDRTASSAVQTGAVRFKQSPVQTTQTAEKDQRQTGYTKGINLLTYINSSAFQPPTFSSDHRSDEDVNIETQSSSNKNQSKIKDDYTHRCKDGSRDMRYKENWGQSKFGSQMKSSSSHNDYGQASDDDDDHYVHTSSLNATHNNSSYSYCPPTPPSAPSYDNNDDDDYHRCKDGSRDMRYKENWGHSKYGDEDLGRERSPSPYKPPSSDDDDDHYVHTSSLNATHNNSSYSYCPPTPPSPSYDDNDDDDDDYHRCKDGSRDMRYEENWGHSKYGDSNSDSD